MTARLHFPTVDGGDRRTSPFGRSVVAAALAAVDPVGARAVEHETAWRSGYLLHFRRLLEAGLDTPEHWWSIATAGLAAVREQMVVAFDDGPDRPLSTLIDAIPSRTLQTARVAGTAAPAGDLVVPYRGQKLHGDALRAQLAQWAESGVLEPSAVTAVGEVIDHPQWLALPGRTVAVLGAGAEMGPVGPLLSWGATVAAVDLPRPELWSRVVEAARASAGTLLVPTSDGDPVAGAGADLLAEIPEIADWVAGLDGRLVLGNYLYADGGIHVRLSVAADVLTDRISGIRPDTSLAFLATPTDAFAAPADAVEQAVAAYRGRSGGAKVVAGPLRFFTRGSLLHRNYPPGADPGIADALVPQQGPNYALAKRIQRWRAGIARHEGRDVSFHVAPSTRTRSVVKNRALAAAFAGARRFGVEVFDPATSNTLMAALLVRDLAGGTVSHDHPWQDEAHAAVHGGLWRGPYAPRSVLGLAAVLGWAASRR